MQASLSFVDGGRSLLRLLVGLLRGTLHGLRLLAANNSRRLCRVALLILFNAAGRVDELLLTRVERMAVGANFNLRLCNGRAGFDDVAANADDFCVCVICWVDFRLHTDVAGM
jgi:hypothetical protein